MLLDRYGRQSEFASALNLMGRNIEDVVTVGTRKEKYLTVIVTAYEQGWLDDLLNEFFEQNEGNHSFREQLAEIVALIWPEGGPDTPHTHLLTANLAFVNRDTIRQHIFETMTLGNPQVLVVTGPQLSGTSYCWRLINHVSHSSGRIRTVYINFDRLADNEPLGVMEAIADVAGFDPPKPRNDLLVVTDQSDRRATQLAQSLCQWFLGKADDEIRAKGHSLWLVFDNAHRDTVPPVTKDLVKALIDNVSDGAIQRLALFILGAETPVAINGFGVLQVEVPPLGRQDVVQFLRQVETTFDHLGDFESVEAAAAEITANCDFSKPDRNALKSVTDQLSVFVRSVM